MKIRLFLSVLLTIGLLGMGCGKKDDKKDDNTAKPTTPDEKPEAPDTKAKPDTKPATPPPAADPAAEAKKIYDTRCVTCHGTTGNGDGPGAAALNPKPRKYSDKEWQNSVKDEDIAKAIVEGGPAIGKSPLMPPNPDLKGKDAVVAELVKIIRGFAAE